MAGRPKGLLLCPDATRTTLVDHWRGLAQAAGIDCVLVGRKTEYSHLDLPTLSDEPPDLGPIGGLRALLQYCQKAGASTVAVACDMPYVTFELLCRLCTTSSHRPAVAPRHPVTQLWEPLFAKYEPSLMMHPVESSLSRREYSLQRVLTAAKGEQLPLSLQEWPLLRDWDREEDIVK